MDDEVIEALADAFSEQLTWAQGTPGEGLLRKGILGCVIAVAVAIHDNEPTYDLRYFYKRAGYPEPYPIHDM